MQHIELRTTLRSLPPSQSDHKTCCILENQNPSDGYDQNSAQVENSTSVLHGLPAGF
jgi:hypothetical protein